MSGSAWASEAERWRQTALGPDVVLIDGFHALKHALRFGADVRLAYASDKSSVRALSEQLADDLTDLMQERVVEVPGQVLRELVPRVHPTAVAALAVRPSVRANLDALARLPRRAPVVVLDSPRNLGNIGAVIRLAAGFGATGVITTGDIDPWHPNVVRGSAGLHFATAVERRDLSELPSGPLYVLDADGEDIRSVRIPDDALLAFGSERHGISPEFRDRATRVVAIPMKAHVSSFNLATSVAMTLFHWLSGLDVPRRPGGQ